MRPLASAVRLPGAASNRRDGAVTVGLVVLSQLAHFLTLSALPLFLPLVRADFAIDFTDAGVLSAAGIVSYALAQIPAGYLSDRIGPRRIFFIGLLGWSALSLTLGLIHSYSLAVVNQFFAGVFRALLFAPGLALLASWFPAHRRATAMGLFLVGSTFGTILVSLSGPWLSALCGWRAAFILFASIGILVACAFGLLGREPQRPGPRQPLTRADLLRVVRSPVVHVCIGLQMVRFSVVSGLAFWLPSFLVADRDLSVSAAGLVVAMSAALSAPSNALGGYVSDRLGNPPLVIGGSLVALAAASALLPVVESPALLLAVIAAYSIFQGFYFGPLFLVPMEVLGPRLAGTATGVANLFANIGGFTTVYALGRIRDASGSFAWGFFAIGAACVVGIVLAALLARLRSRALGGKTKDERR